MSSVRASFACLLLTATTWPTQALAALPAEPVTISTRPQFVHDLGVVDTTWSLNPKQDQVLRVFHQPTKWGTTPLITAGDPSSIWVTHDVPAKMFRMWFQANANGHTEIDYSESTQGLKWSTPVTAIPFAADPAVLEFIPAADLHGFKYVMSYFRGGRLFVAGSQDGITWTGETQISSIASDTHNTIVYDPTTLTYTMYLRARDTYRAPGQTDDPLDTGDSRRSVAAISSKCLWCAWSAHAETILAPDETDTQMGYSNFYGMPSVLRTGIEWGFLQNFELNDHVRTELVWSRDASNFQRLPARTTFLPFGAEGSWDGHMIYVSPSWVEAGTQEWFFYYNGWNAPHGTAARVGGIGLARIKRERLISQHGPAGGGVVATRQLLWPGGGLFVNADASQGSLSVRVSTAGRIPVPNFDYTDCATFTGDSTSQEITWASHSIRELAGVPIRLEFQLTNADLYEFHAAGVGQ